MKRILAMVQARMSSKRLPGKILTTVHGSPLLGYLLERLDHCRELNGVVLLTSAKHSDDPVADFCAANKTPCFRGPLQNVAERFALALETHPCDGFVRISADSPLLDPALVDRCVRAFRSGDHDMVTNVQVRTFPKGQSVEVMRTATYLNAQQFFATSHEKEHVTPHFYAHATDYDIRNLRCESNLGAVQTSVDTPEELARFERVVSSLNRPHWEYGYQDIASKFLREACHV